MIPPPPYLLSRGLVDIGAIIHIQYKMLLPLLLLPFIAVANATTYTLNHRFIDSASGSASGSVAGFTKYGTIDIPEDRDVNEVIRIDALSTDIKGHGERKGWYQVQMDGEGLGAGVLSSTKAVCAFFPLLD